MTVLQGIPQNVQFEFYSDSVAQERNETFTLQLKVAGGLPTGAGVFFVNKMDMIILDSDSKIDG